MIFMGPSNSGYSMILTIEQLENISNLIGAIKSSRYGQRKEGIFSCISASQDGYSISWNFLKIKAHIVNFLHIP